MGKHGRPLKTSRYMTQARKGHPTAHADGRVRVHRANLFDAIGPGEHPCHWCKKPVEWFATGPRELVADHVDGNTWNNDPANLVPACQRCNKWRVTLYSPVCPRGHEWERFTYTSPQGRRSCRECHRLNEKKAWVEGRRS